jgi:hypothetical protein
MVRVCSSHGVTRNSYNLEKLNNTDHLGGTGVDGRIILKRIISKHCVSMCHLVEERVE